jgi:hypothetical protein
MKGQKMNLSDGTYIDIVDHSSIAVLIRAALESYLTFNHVFISTLDLKEKEFRFLCWDLYGFIERKDFLAESEEAINRLEQEKKLTIKSIDRIRTFESYKKLKDKDKTKIEKGYWKLNKKWADLAEEAGFGRGIFIDTYSYLCSYSHTGRLSATQIMQSKTKEEQMGLAKVLLGYALMILSKFIIDYVKLIPETKPSFDSNQKGKNTARLWKEIAENIKK